MGTLRKRLSLDWLKLARGESTAPQGSEETRGAAGEDLPPYMEDALIAYGGKVLESIQAQGGKAHLHDVVKDADLRLEDVIPVAEHLKRKGWIEFVEEDPRLSNHLARLTDLGKGKMGVDG